ncbi:MAG: ABC transporter permease [Nitratireductor sp.]|nr:ABC transporter permease [Nitratireductor sp.]
MADLAQRKPIDVRRQAGFGTIAIACVAVLYLPIVVIILYSFNSASSLGANFKGLTLEWYRLVFADAAFFEATWMSLVIATCATGIATVLATMAALGTTRKREWTGQRAAFIMINSPLMVPEIITAISLLVFFSSLSTYTGIEFGIGKLILSHTVFCIPFAYLPIRARLEGMGLDLEQAAADLYARPRDTFRYVTLPLLAPGIGSGAALAFIVSFDDFTISQFVAGPGETTLPLYIWSRIRRTLTPELNAMCTLILLVSIALIVVGFVIANRRKSEK